MISVLLLLMAMSAESAPVVGVIVTVSADLSSAKNRLISRSIELLGIFRIPIRAAC